MLRNVFMKNIRDQRRALIWWSFGVSTYAILIMLFYPSIRESAEIMDQYIATMPKEMVGLFFQEGMSMSSPEGFLQAELFSFMAPLFFLIFTISFASSTVAGEEQRGSLAILLTNPITRWQVILHKFAAMVVSTLLLAIVFWATLVLGAQFVEAEISFPRIAAAIFSTVLLGLSFGTLALTLGCVTGSRGLSLGLTCGLAAGAYLLNALGPNIDALSSWYRISPFYLALGQFPLINGLHLSHALILMCLPPLLLLIGIVTFERRDLTG